MPAMPSPQLTYDSIIVHIRKKPNTVVKIDSNCLPEEIQDLLKLLANEIPPRKIWLQLARAYDAVGKRDVCISILEQATSPELEDAFLRYDNDKSVSQATLLSTLAGCWLMEALAEKSDARKRDAWLSRASEALNKAETFDLDDLTVWEAKGWREVIAGNFEGARGHFQFVTESSSRATGVLGLGLVFLRNPGTEKENATTAFRTGLKRARCPPSAWIGLAHAENYLGKSKHAKELLNRALVACSEENNIDQVEALIGLATLEYNDKTSQGYVQALQYLKKAFILSRGTDVRISSFMAEILFLAGDIKRAEILAQQAINNISSLDESAAKSEVYFQHARILHYLESFSEAQNYYLKSIEAANDSFLPVHPGAKLGLGMLLLSLDPENSLDIAIDHLEFVAKKDNEQSPEICCYLGVALYLRLQKIPDSRIEERCVKLLTKGTAKCKEADIPALLSLADLIAESNPVLSLESYQKAESAWMHTFPDDLPVPIWNNIAALSFRLGRITEAQKYLINAKEQAKNLKYPSSHLFILEFNYGMLLEASGQREEATKIYKQLLEKCPDYSDLYIRLGLIAEENNDFEEAKRGFEEAAKHVDSKLTASTCLANLLRKQKNFPELQKLLEEHANDDAYSSIALAGFYIDVLEHLDPDRKDRMITRIGGRIARTLRESTDNAVAACGAGIYLAESGKFREARDAFASIVGHSVIGDCAKMNLAHAQMDIGTESMKISNTLGNIETGVFDQAAKLYSDVAKSSTEGLGSQDIFMYLGNALFQSRNYQEALIAIQKAIHRAPMYSSFFFNLALCLQEIGDQVDLKVASAKKLAVVVDFYERAHRVFGHLRNQPNNANGVGPLKKGVSRSTAEQHYRYCKDRYSKARTGLVNAKIDEEKLEEKLALDREMFEKKRALEKEKLEQQEREEKEKQKKLAAKIREMEEEFQKRLERDREKKAAAEAAESSGSEERKGEDGEEKKPAKRAKRKRKTVDEGKPTKAKGKRKGRKSRRDDDDNDGIGEFLPATSSDEDKAGSNSSDDNFKGRRLMNKYISSDESNISDLDKMLDNEDKGENKKPSKLRKIEDDEDDEDDADIFG